ncbi:hypothetical protein L2E82_35809 [Cichorium intybus]|uniref:Uncharacterized protein n=1 Tax=Cichorium intybus TaxID=13427 RepID=A0ACB9BPY7_CICIN|nr:hypothetical protein L2E82_35809 [Cichorium intybus]
MIGIHMAIGNMCPPNGRKKSRVFVVTEDHLLFGSLTLGLCTTAFRLRLYCFLDYAGLGFQRAIVGESGCNIGRYALPQSG